MARWKHSIAIVSFHFHYSCGNLLTAAYKRVIRHNKRSTSVQSLLVVCLYQSFFPESWKELLTYKYIHSIFTQFSQHINANALTQLHVKEN